MASGSTKITASPVATTTESLCWDECMTDYSAVGAITVDRNARSENIEMAPKILDTSGSAVVNDGKPDLRQWRFNKGNCPTCYHTMDRTMKDFLNNRPAKKGDRVRKKIIVGGAP
jgi:hypothetical protein